MTTRRRRCPIGFLMILLFAAATSAGAEPGGKATIAVLPFDLAGSVVDGTPLETNVLTDAFSRVLVNSRKFVVVDRARLERVRREQRFGASGLVDPGTQARLGRILGADYLVVGKVLDLSAGPPKQLAYGSGWGRPVRVSVEVQVIDASSAKIVSAKQGDATAQSRASTAEGASGVPRAAIEQAIAQVATDTLNAIVSAAYPLRIVDVDGETVRLNRGADGGLEVGTVLRCFGRGRALVDPDTKESLGFSETEAGSVRIDEVLPKITIARTVGGGRFQTGDTCRGDEAAADEAGTHRAPPPPGPIHAY